MKKSKLMQSLLLSLGLGFVAVGGSAQAAYVTSNGACEAGNVTLTSITKSVGGDVIHTGQAINATSCFGVVTGNDSGNFTPGGDNRGYLNDGLLNGGGKATGGKGNKPGDGIAPDTFITADQYLNLDGEGEATDPGWIYLGKHEKGSFEYATVKNDPDTLNIGDILTFSLTGNEWTLATKPGIVETAQAVLGDRNTFDHLALILKAGKGYVVYDFDFNIFAPQLLNAGFDYETPYTFSGTWNTADLGGKGLSHMSVWARDPIPGPGSPSGGEDQPIPAPASLALLGLGLTMLGLRRRQVAA